MGQGTLGGTDSASRGHHRGGPKLALAISQLRKQTFGVVLTKRRRADPDNAKQLLLESIVPSFSVDDILRRI